MDITMILILTIVGINMVLVGGKLYRWLNKGFKDERTRGDID